MMSPPSLFMLLTNNLIMTIVENENGNYRIDDLSYNDANRILMSLKKTCELMGKAQYDNEYHKQEAARLKEEYEEIISEFENEIPKGIAQGLNDDILKLI